MADESSIAGRTPAAVELKEGQKYAFCTWGNSSNQPFCDGAHRGSSFTPHVFTAEKSGQVYLCMCKRTCKTPFCDGSHKSLPTEAS